MYTKTHVDATDTALTEAIKATVEKLKADLARYNTALEVIKTVTDGAAQQKACLKEAMADAGLPQTPAASGAPDDFCEYLRGFVRAMATTLRSMTTMLPDGCNKSVLSDTLIAKRGETLCTRLWTWSWARIKTLPAENARTCTQWFWDMVCIELRSQQKVNDVCATVEHGAAANPPGSSGGHVRLRFGGVNRGVLDMELEPDEKLLLDLSPVHD